MKHIINELRMPGLTLRQKAAAWYFIVSFCLLGCTADSSSMWAIVLVAANFGIAALTVKKAQLFKKPEPVQEDF